jgi:DNA-binding transcriptional ArsR family regulator
MTMTSDQIRGMIDYRHMQSNKNIEFILNALQELNKNKGPVSSREIEQFLSEKKREEVQSIYNNCMLTFDQSSRQVKKISKSMVYRTVQRHLSVLVGRGLVTKKDNKYILSSTGKREIQFRNFASGYGNMALNNIMNCHFPTVSTLEDNVVRLIPIFGIYIVYCLIEAVRLIAANDNSQRGHWHSYYFGNSSNFSKDGEFKEEKLVSSWIKDVFNPWQMLNLFLTAISNVEEGSMKKEKGDDNAKQEIALDKYREYYGELTISPRMTFLSNTSNNSARRVITPAPTTLDLALYRGFSLHNSRSHRHSPNNKTTLGSLMDQNINQMFKLLIDYGYQGKLLYEVNNEKVLELKKILEKRYPRFFSQLQKTDEYFYSKYG